MAGKRQHFIPRFLQEGFTTGNSKGREQTWVFRRDTAPFKSNIANVGVEGRFYTYEGNSEADDLITVAESEFSTLVRALRTSTASSLTDPKISHLIAHFETRTRHFRENILHVGNSMVAVFLDFMSDENAFADWLIETILGNPAIIRQVCARELTDKGLPQDLLEPLVQLSTDMGPSLVNLQRKQFRGLAQALRPKLIGILEEKVKSAHIRALRTSIAPEKKVEMLSDLNYAVHRAVGESLILGDSVVLFRVDGDRLYKTFLEKKDKLEAVYMPIDSNTALVGESLNCTRAPGNLREVLASGSLEHFIAADNSEENQSLQSTIGTDARLLTKLEMIEIMREVLAEVGAR